MPTSSPAPVPRTVIGRRAFLHTTAGAVTIGSAALLSSCSTSVEEIISGKPTPDPALVELRKELLALSQRHAAAGESSLTSFYESQAEAISAEQKRLCGVDREGNPREDCGPDPSDAAAGTGAVSGSNGGNDTDAAESAYLNILSQSTESVTSSVARQLAAEQILVAGLYAAFSTTQASATWDAIEAIDRTSLTPALKEMTTSDASVPRGATPTGEQMRTLLSLCYESLYASGLALAADDGTFRPVITVTADRIRALRNDLINAFKGNEDVPAPNAGYRLPGDGQRPASPRAAAELFHSTLIPMTQQLRSLTGAAGGSYAGEFFGRWTGITARSEAALERGLGINPLAQIARGESNEP